jgi:hypothetical protein
MFDVQSFHCSGQAEFHASPAAGCQNDQFDRKLDFGNVSYEVLSICFPDTRNLTPET